MNGSIRAKAQISTLKKMISKFTIMPAHGTALAASIREYTTALLFIERIRKNIWQTIARRMNFITRIIIITSRNQTR